MSTTDHTREALEALVAEKYNGSPGYITDAILASPWLAAHVAAAVEGKDAEIERLTEVVASTQRDRDARKRQRDKARSAHRDLEQAIAALCDDDWLRRRDRCMELNGTHARHDRDAASAWESAANHLRALLGQDYNDRLDRHDTYLEWMRGDRDRGQAERGEVPVEKRYRGWPTQARTPEPSPNETVTYDGFGAPIVRDGGGTDG